MESQVLVHKQTFSAYSFLPLPGQSIWRCWLSGFFSICVYLKNRKTSGPLFFFLKKRVGGPVPCVKNLTVFAEGAHLVALMLVLKETHTFPEVHGH